MQAHYILFFTLLFSTIFISSILNFSCAILFKLNKLKSIINSAFSIFIINNCRKFLKYPVSFPQAK